MLLDCSAVERRAGDRHPKRDRETTMQMLGESTKNGLEGPRRARHAVVRSAGWVLLWVTVVFAGGCASQGDLLRLQEQVAEHHQAGSGAPDPFARIAQLAAEVDSMRQEILDLEGELELARKESADALAEIRATRTTLARQSAEAAAASVALGIAADGGAELGVDEALAPAPDQQLVGYQQALDAWRGDEYPACIERFTGFLQSYPTSSYADDEAFWLADCTFKNREFKRAVIRFSDVVRVYPDSPKAPDALYRQGESLLKLGPRFEEAARTVFRRLQKDYPDSERAAEAAQQLDRLGPGANPPT